MPRIMHEWINGRADLRFSWTGNPVGVGDLLRIYADTSDIMSLPTEYTGGEAIFTEEQFAGWSITGERLRFTLVSEGEETESHDVIEWPEGY